MLIDTILRFAQSSPVCGDDEDFYDKRLVYELSRATRFQVDNVAQYFHENVGKLIDIQKEMPNIAPVAPAMWFEYGGLAAGKESYRQYGCLLTIDYDAKEGIDEKKWADFDVPTGTHWVLRSDCFSSDLVCISNNVWIDYIFVKEDGTFLYSCAGVNKRKSHAMGFDDVPDKTEHNTLNAERGIAFLSLCFSHCKGTEIREHQPSRQVRRAAERTGKPVYTFHTIDIGPSTNALRTEGRVSENGLARALHICRGHFAHYTAEKPLFGKYTGTVYKPMHVRGSAEQGISAKDYRIHPAAQAGRQ